MVEHSTEILIALNFLAVVGLVVVGWLVKSYVPTYLSKKAEHFATKENFAEVLKLQKETAKEIETIKAQVSTGAWIDQRRWDLKRNLYSRLLEVFHELRKTTATVAATYSPEQDQEFIARNKDFFDKQKQRQRELLDEAGKLSAVAALIVDETALNAIEGFRNSAAALGSESNPYTYMLALSDTAARVYELLLVSARKDLLAKPTSA